MPLRACSANLGQRAADAASPAPWVLWPALPAGGVPGRLRASHLEIRDTGTRLCLSWLNLGLPFHTQASAVDFVLVTISKRLSKGSEVLLDACHKANWTRETFVSLQTEAKTRVEAIAANTGKGIWDWQIGFWQILNISFTSLKAVRDRNYTNEQHLTEAVPQMEHNSDFNQINRLNSQTEKVYF